MQGLMTAYPRQKKFYRYVKELIVSYLNYFSAKFLYFFSFKTGVFVVGNAVFAVPRRCFCCWLPMG
jgi:hypothetical protein